MVKKKIRKTLVYFGVGVVVFKIECSAGMHSTSKNDGALFIFDLFADIGESNLYISKIKTLSKIDFRFKFLCKHYSVRQGDTVQKVDQELVAKNEVERN